MLWLALVFLLQNVRRELFDRAKRAAYAHHCDSQHNEPDKIADVAIVDKALEETGIDMPFSDAMSYYRQVEGRLYRNTAMGKACGRPAQICRKRARPEACYSEIQREFRVKVAGSSCSCRCWGKECFGTGRGSIFDGEVLKWREGRRCN